jgi:hypothetical protein
VTDNVIAMLIADANSSNRTDRASSAVVSGVKKAKTPWYSFASR